MMPAMSLKFTKMHGIGNDYVYVDGFEQKVDDPPAVARFVADRHFGVGGDGLVIIQPPDARANHGRMEMYNADGSRAQMCGNAIRCVSKYLVDRGYAQEDTLRVETDAGLKVIYVERDADGTPNLFAVDMGAPGLARDDLPMTGPFEDGGEVSRGDRAIAVPLEAAGLKTSVTAVSMGNPHAVIRYDEIQTLDGTPLPPLADAPLWHWGPIFENHEWFPERTNTEFIVPLSRTELDFRVWERGSGETLACGTGACAAVVAAHLNGWCDREVTVHLRGGDLKVRWDGADDSGTVWMTGGATEVFSGELLS